MKKVSAAIFYSLALAVYIAVTVWRFALGEEIGWTYFPVVVFGILPASAFFCKETRKRCVRVGKNAKKVHNTFYKDELK